MLLRNPSKDSETHNDSICSHLTRLLEHSVWNNVYRFQLWGERQLVPVQPSYFPLCVAELKHSCQVMTSDRHLLPGCAFRTDKDDPCKYWSEFSMYVLPQELVSIQPAHLTSASVVLTYDAKCACISLCNNRAYFCYSLTYVISGSGR